MQRKMNNKVICISGAPESKTQGSPKGLSTSEVRDINHEVGSHSTSQAQRLKKAFAELESKGYFAAMHYQCCQSCGWAAVPEGKDKVVFYHDQDSFAFGYPEMGDDYNNPGNLQHKLYLAWSGDAAEIIKVLADHGLETEWGGSEKTRIAILPEGGETDESTESSQQADKAASD